MRRAGYYWEKRTQAYRTDSGGRTKRFYGIARDDQVGIATAFSSYISDLDAESRPPEPTGLDIALAFTKEPMGRKPRTVQSHRERLVFFSKFKLKAKDPALGSLRAAEYRAAHLKSLVKKMKAEGHSPHYITGIVSSVKAAFNWAASEEGGSLISSSPFGREVKAPPIPRSPERYATRAEVAAFLRFAKNRAETVKLGKIPKKARKDDVLKTCALYRGFARQLLLLVRVSAHTGARPGSLASAWWEDFDPARGTIILPPDRHKTGHKTARALTIHLPPILVRALTRKRGKPGSHPVAIFTHKRGRGGVDRGAEKEAGEPWGKFTTLPNGKPSFDADTGPLCRTVRKLRAEVVAEAKRRKNAGKPMRGLDLIQDEGDNRFVIYKLRHTSISDDIMNGGNIATVAELKGTSPRMLETTYTHLLSDHLDQAAKTLHAKRRTRDK